MRLLKLAFILSLIPAFSFAQRGGAHAGGGARGGVSAGGGVRSSPIGGTSRGLGTTVVPRSSAIGTPGVYRNGFINNGGIITRVPSGIYGVNRGLGYSGLGYRPIYGYGYGLPFYGFGLGLPYWGAGFGWPAYYNTGYYPDGYYGPGPGDPYGYGVGYGYGDPGADPGYQPQPMDDPDYPQSYPQNYQPNPPSAPAPTETYNRRTDYYLIAFTDHTIQAAVNFHVEGDEIVWTTREQVEKRAPLSTVDRRFSEQINRDRRMDFKAQQ